MEWIERPRRSLYLQRVALLAVCALLLFVPLGIQMLRLTVTQHDTLRDEAESKLVVERLTPTVRGRILDRNGNVLAQDVATYDIAVDYSLITGTWATRRAASHARWDHRGDWPKLSRTQRQQLIEQYLPEFRSKLDLMWLELARRGRVSPETVLQRRARIWQDVEQLADHIAQRRLEQMLAMNVGKETFEELTIEDAAMTIREQTVAHTVLPAVADEVAFDFMRFLDERELGKSERDLRDDPFAGVRVIDSTRREYPFETMTVPIDMSAMPATLRRDERVWVKVQGVDTHIIGWMRDQHFKEDVQHRSEWTETISDEQRERVMASGRDRGRYLLGDAVGHVGLEGASEFNLRGLRGIRRRQLDTGTVTEIAADSGNDVVLTLDIDLQARVQALFDESVGLAVSQPWHTNPYQEPGARLNGAVVVLDVRTSDVLAMVSVPSFTRERFQQHASEMLADEENTPTINRAIAKRYASGSIVKPLMYCGAVRRGVLGRDERIECTGMFYADKPTLYRCWIYKMFGITHSDQLGHGPNGAEAIMASCNIFFYEVGRRLGVDGINDLYRRLGVGSDALGPDFGLLAWPGTASARTLQEAILMGIGQGPIDWTPMHAADAYATLGRGGVRIVPRLRSNAPVQADDLGFDPRTVETALHGLRLGVQRREGTTNHIRYIDEQGQRHDEPIFNAPGVTVWVKSGTADAGKLVSENDLDGDGQPDVIHRDHSWVVCLVGPEGGEPTHAVAVVVDFGGSGGKVAGPIANQIIHQLQALGYLPGGQADETTANARTVGGG